MATFSNGESGLSVRTKINDVLQHADGTAGELVINEAGADVDFRVESDTNANALFVDGATGNVGLGTGAPVAELHIRATSDPELRIDNGSITSQSRLSFMTGPAVDGYIGMTANSGTLDINSGRGVAWGGNLTFTTDTTERMRIDASGNVGIGISSPQNRMTVSGSTSYISVVNTVAGSNASPSFSGIRFYGFAETGDGLVASVEAGNSQTENFAGILRFSTQPISGGGTLERMRIDASGNVGIGTSSPAAKLVVNGASALASVPAVGSNVGLFVATVGAQDYGLISGALTSGAYFFQSQATNGTSETYPILLNPNGGNVVIGTATSGASKLRISGLPTSSAGLSAGDVWNDAGTLKIA